jgi:hypothetical protein
MREVACALHGYALLGEAQYEAGDFEAARASCLPPQA